MVPDYIALAGPVFFVLIVVELFVERRRGVSYYRVNDAINSISTGLLMQLSMLFAKGLLVAGYLGIYENFDSSISPRFTREHGSPASSASIAPTTGFID